MESLKRITLSFILFSIFAVFQANIILNTHIHYIDGIAYTHSHPNDGEHTHSQAEIWLLDRLSVFHSLKPENITYRLCLQIPDDLIREENNILFIKDSFCKCFHLRAPPTGLYFDHTRLINWV